MHDCLITLETTLARGLAASEGENLREGFGPFASKFQRPQHASLRRGGQSRLRKP